ncbi:MAG: RIO1 family regulatory kinase/ATPase [Candidatus Bathyarchaeota archaeon]
MKGLIEKRYVEVLCYPRYDQKEARKRLEELKKLGVKALEFAGEKKAFDVYVLGKGYVGIVVAAYTDVGKAALKIRRVDADRAGMHHEAEMLKKANDVGVGPKLLRVAEDFLLMEFIEGTPLPKWVEALKGRGTRARVHWVLQDILEQCWRLDEASLDHGELSWAPKHVIVDVDGKPYIVDFETASSDRRVSNVTSICQYIFLGSKLAKTMKGKLGEVDTGSLIHCLRDYKQERTRENFEKVLIVCGLK